jgi:hypothetical protein
MPRHLFAGLAAVAVAGAVLLPSTAAQAFPICPANSQCSYAWFSSAAHTTQVGGRTIDCQRVSQSWGTQTAYLVYNSQPC